jgi:hypothetical protein
MRPTDRAESWVVYVMNLRNKAGGRNAVCEQGEWDALERAYPGHHTLIRAGIPTEGEAERLARSTPVCDTDAPAAGPAAARD